MAGVPVDENEADGVVGGWVVFLTGPFVAQLENANAITARKTSRSVKVHVFFIESSPPAFEILGGQISSTLIIHLELKPPRQPAPKETRAIKKRCQYIGLLPND